MPPALPDDLVEDLVDAGSREHYADAALYDYEYRRRRADVTFYRELARQRGAGRILELGAGTGRVTIPLARDGHQVTALDQSAAMLGRLRDRAARLAPSAAARITPVTGDLRTFAVAASGTRSGTRSAGTGTGAAGSRTARGATARFPLAIAAFNVLEHLYTRGEVTACLQRVAAHLEPGGAFAFDVQLPDLAWLIRDPSRRWARTRFTDPTTGRAMIYSTNHDYDPVSQIALIRLYYELADEPARSPGARGRRSSGAERHAAQPRSARSRSSRRGDGAGSSGGLGRLVRVVKLSQRKFFPAELEALVAAAGFRVTERYGDFSFRPLDASADSQVLVCEPVPKPRRKSPISR